MNRDSLTLLLVVLGITSIVIGIAVTPNANATTIFEEYNKGFCYFNFLNVGTISCGTNEDTIHFSPGKGITFQVFPSNKTVLINSTGGINGSGSWVTGGSNLGGSYQIYNSLQGTSMLFRGINAGTGMSASQTNNYVTLSTSFKSDNVSCASGYAVTAYNNSTGTYSCTAVSGSGGLTGIQGNNLGSGSPIFAGNYNASDLNFYTLGAGQGLSVTTTNNVVTYSTNFKANSITCGNGYFITSYSNSTGNYSCAADSESSDTDNFISSINGNTSSSQTIQGTANRVTVTDSGSTHTIDVAFRVNNATCNTGYFIQSFDNKTGNYICGQPTTTGITSVNSQIGPSISITRGTGISVTNNTNDIVIGNTGVTSISGTVGNITASSSTGSVTLNLGSYAVVTNGLKQEITKELDLDTLKLTGNANGNSKNFTSLNEVNFTKGFQNGNQVIDTISQGTGIGVSGSGNSRTITNNGVTSLSATSPITVNASSGKVSIACATCSTSGANVTGGGTSPQIAYWSTSSNIKATGGLQWDSSNTILKGITDVATSLGTSIMRFNNIFASTTNSTTVLTNNIDTSTGNLISVTGPTTFTSGNKLTTTPSASASGINIGTTSAYYTSPRQGDLGIIGSNVKYNDNTNTTQTLSPINSMAHNFTSPTNPATTTSTTGVMSNLLATISPKVTGNLLVTICGQMQSGTAGDGAQFDVRYGTSLISEGSAIGNTLVGTAKGVTSSTASKPQTVCNTVQITGLTVGTKYLFQIGKYAVTGGTATFSNFNVSVLEF